MNVGRVSVSWGCHNSLLEAQRLKQQFIFTVLEAGKFKVKCVPEYYPKYLHMLKSREQEASLFALSYKGINPTHEGSTLKVPPSDTNVIGFG